jgi:hypothetical protein
MATRRPWRSAGVLGAIAATVVVGALLAGAFAESGARAPLTSRWAATGALIDADLAVTPCETSYGVPESRHVTLPPRITAQVSRKDWRGLTMFTDGLGTLDVVGPTAWHCTALDAVDGSSTLIVYPPGEPQPTWGDVTAVRQGIVATRSGRCVGCALLTACPLFALAAVRYELAYGVRCHTAGAAEQRRHVSVSKVLFIDPPGVLGAGRPSGGGTTAYGAMLWRAPRGTPPTTWLATCTLPTEDHDLCVLSVRAFLARLPDR